MLYVTINFTIWDKNQFEDMKMFDFYETWSNNHELNGDGLILLWVV